MDPADFKVIKSDVWLKAEDFELSPLWGSYYAPEDVDEIVSWGFEADQVRATPGGQSVSVSHFIATRP